MRNILLLLLLCASTVSAATQQELEAEIGRELRRLEIRFIDYAEAKMVKIPSKYDPVKRLVFYAWSEPKVAEMGREIEVERVKLRWDIRVDEDASEYTVPLRRYVLHREQIPDAKRVVFSMSAKDRFGGRRSWTTAKDLFDNMIAFGLTDDDLITAAERKLLFPLTEEGN